jgi:hypothetical protein
MFIELKSYDDTGTKIDSFKSTDYVKLSVEYSDLTIDSDKATVFWLNTNDSIWYDVTKEWQPGGVVGTDFFNDTVNKVVSVRLNHFSHYYVGEGWTDTVTVVINEDITSDSIYYNSVNVPVISVYILGDTVTGDTLTRFSVANLGNINAPKLEDVKLWCGEVDNKVEIADLNWNQDSGVWSNENLNQVLPLEGETFTVTISLNNLLQLGDSFQAMIPAEGVSTVKEYDGPIANRVNTGILSAHIINEISITSPQTGIDTHFQTITISGTKNHLLTSDTIIIIINNDTVAEFNPADTGVNWDTDVNLNVGYNNILVRLVSNNTVSADSISLNYIPVSVFLISPADSYVYITNELEIEFSGTTLLGETVIVLVNADTNYANVSDLENDTADWNFTLDQESGLLINDTTNIELIGFDNIGNQSISLYCTVFVQVIPEIRITSPQSGIDTHFQTITISGTKIHSLASDTIEIIINSESYEIYEIGNTDLNWDTKVGLAIGENIISVRLTSCDTVWEDSITVNYLPIGFENDLNNAVLVPNPFRPNDGNEMSGLYFSGSANDIYNRTGIHILKLTDNVKIEIYDILGRRVNTIYNIEGYGMAIWDGKNSSGNDVVSGTYLFVLSNDFQRKVLKLAIIR